MNPTFINALSTLEQEHNISKLHLIKAIEKALLASYKKKYNTDANVEIVIDSVTGTIRIVLKKLVVDEILDERLEITIDEARSINPICELDDYIEVEIEPANFGRMAINVAKQVITEQIKAAQNNNLQSLYVDKDDSLMKGTIIGQDPFNYYVQLDTTEAILPKNETMRSDQFSLNQEVVAYMVGFENHSKKGNILLSRNHPGYLKKILELHIPGIANGAIQIQSIAREAGYRSKVAVTTSHPDFIGRVIEACVGDKDSKGALIREVISHLGSEKLDIIEWFEEPEQYIQSALNPAQVIRVDVLDEENARVIVHENQLTLAIGIKGQNVRLAARLTGYKIDLYSETSALVADLTHDE
ncbi:Transcription termination/antitermination protein NusA [Paenibacillus nuruki]|uniref:Transcription termination/antitermination protein NusA n=1 Tax=Paenibacillus nuruki TaxID=1886670 RepID=A0A1E3L124_9BACL|nr:MULTISPECIES: transcription termination factor NusA [Paenibacillus]ODP26660.1 Transcription termination/antitermination protein NusA [Paenibacillus nuruki]